jgi:hypothetical protein
MMLKALTRAAAGIVAMVLAGAALAAGPNYPFGSRLESYPNGTTVSHVTSAVMDPLIKTHYDDWKRDRVAAAPPAIPGGKVILFSNSPNPKLTVSEGMGYGMLITVVMAGHDPSAQAQFDALLTTVRARPAVAIRDSYSVTNPQEYQARNYAQHWPNMMSWYLAQDGSPEGGWPATDGELDIALALLMADRQWGSLGTWNYKQEAVKTINAIKAFVMYDDGRIRGRPTENSARTSDFMFGHFRAFRQATGDAFWDTAVSQQLRVLEQTIAGYSQGPGLQPDCLINTNTTTPKPSDGGANWVCDYQSTTEMFYYANAQRNPWRFGTDYIFSADSRVRAILMKMMAFIVTDTGGNPGSMPHGYRLDGTRIIDGNWPARAMIGPAMTGAQVDASFQAYLNASWDWINGGPSNNPNFITGYYDSELMLIPMLVASGNWWSPVPRQVSSPPPPPPPPTGPVVRVEAESAARAGTLTIQTAYPGYSGNAYVGQFSDASDRLTATFGNVVAGNYDIRIRYHTDASQQNFVTINSSPPQDQAFPATGGQWATKTIAGVALGAGSNSISISPNWGWIYVDYIEIAPAGTPAPARVEAENATRAGTLTNQTAYPGYSGNAYVGQFSDASDRLTATFGNVVAGSYDIRIRYHTDATQQNFVTINNNPPQDQAFPATGGQWATKTIAGVALGAGSNSISISPNWGWIYVDYIEIAPSGT